MSLPETVICRTLPELFDVMDELRQWDVTQPLAIRYGTIKQSRSSQQNALYWKWLTIIGKVFGMSKEELHSIYKYKFGAPIFIRDDPHYADMADAIKDLKRMPGMQGHYAALRHQVIKMTSTTDFSVKQMSEYMSEIYQLALNERITLPVPDDMKWLEINAIADDRSYRVVSDQ